MMPGGVSDFLYRHNRAGAVYAQAFRSWFIGQVSSDGVLRNIQS